eukprot:Hpha_TRINITY_DN5054_c0_g1::TRINITY_DN5054_c0_g1_i1::g.94154::m.94154
MSCPSPPQAVGRERPSQFGQSDDASPRMKASRAHLPGGLRPVGSDGSIGEGASQQDESPRSHTVAQSLGHSPRPGERVDSVSSCSVSALDSTQPRGSQSVYREELIRLRAELMEKEKQLDKLRSEETDAMQAIRARFRREIEEQGQRCIELTSQVAERDATLQALRQDMSRAESRHVLEHSELRLALQQKERRISDLEDERAGWEESAGRDRQRAEAAEAAERRAVERLGGLLENTQARGTVERLRQERQEWQDSERVLQKRIRELEAQSAQSTFTISPENTFGEEPVLSKSASCPAGEMGMHLSLDVSKNLAAAPSGELSIAELRERLSAAEEQVAHTNAATGRRLRQINDTMEKAANPAAAKLLAKRRGQPTVSEELKRAEGLAHVITDLRRDIARDGAQRGKEQVGVAALARRLQEANDLLARAAGQTAKPSPPQQQGQDAGGLTAEVDRAERNAAALEGLADALADATAIAAAAQRTAVADSAAKMRMSLTCDQLRRELDASNARAPDSQAHARAVEASPADDAIAEAAAVRKQAERAAEAAAAKERELRTALQEAEEQVERARTRQRKAEEALQSERQRNLSDEIARAESTARPAISPDRPPRDKKGRGGSPGSPEPEDDLRLFQMQALQRSVRSLRDEVQCEQQQRGELLNDIAEANRNLREAEEHEQAVVREARARADAADRAAAEMAESSLVAAKVVRRVKLSLQRVLGPRSPTFGEAEPSDVAVEAAQCDKLIEALGSSRHDKGSGPVNFEFEAQRLRHANDAVDRVLPPGDSESPVCGSNALAEEVNRAETLVTRAERLATELRCERESAAAASERAVAEAGARTKVALELQQAKRQLQRLQDSKAEGDERSQRQSVASVSAEHEEEVRRLRKQLSAREAEVRECLERMRQTSNGLGEAMCSSPVASRFASKETEIVQVELTRLEGLAWRAGEQLRQAASRGMSSPEGIGNAYDEKRLARACSEIEDLLRKRGVTVAREKGASVATRIGALRFALEREFGAADSEAETLREREALLQGQVDEAERLRSKNRKERQRLESALQQQKDGMQAQLQQRISAVRAEAADAQSALSSATASAATRLRGINDALEDTFQGQSPAVESPRRRGALSPSKVRRAMSPGAQSRPRQLQDELERTAFLVNLARQRVEEVQHSCMADATQAAETRAMLPRLRAALDAAGAPQATGEHTHQLAAEVSRAEAMALVNVSPMSRPVAASPGSPSRSVEMERRLDPADGGSYTYGEFIDCYGQAEAAARWATAPLAATMGDADEMSEKTEFQEEPRGRPFVRTDSGHLPRSSSGRSMTNPLPTPHAVHGYLGMEVSAGVTVGTELFGSSGVRVTHVAPDGPAERAGVRKGDVIYEAAGRVMTSLANFRSVAQHVMAGETVVLFVQRPGQTSHIRLPIVAATRHGGGGGERSTQRRKLTVLTVRSQRRSDPPVSGGRRVSAPAVESPFTSRSPHTRRMTM